MDSLEVVAIKDIFYEENYYHGYHLLSPYRIGGAIDIYKSFSNRGTQPLN